MTVTRDRKIRVGWRSATVWSTRGCRACNYPSAGPRDVRGDGQSFLMALCRKYGAFPYTAVPRANDRLRSLIKAHYRRHHPEIEIR